MMLEAKASTFVDVLISIEFNVKDVREFQQVLQVPDDGFEDWKF